MKNLHKALAYEASAGSGKTFALVIRYISLLYLGAKPNTILTLTFTNKAANEMKERINLVLKELHLPKRKVELNEIKNATSLSINDILSKQSHVYKNFLQSDLKISTIDKFFAQILRNFSLYLAMMPDFQIEEKKDEYRFKENFISEVKKHNSYKDLIKFALLQQKKLSSIFSLLDELYAKDGELQNIKNTNYKIIQNNKQKIISLAKDLENLFLGCEQLSNAAKKTLQIKTLEDLLTKSWIEKDTLNYHYFKKCFTPDADKILLDLKNELSIYFLNQDRHLKDSYLNLYEIYKTTKRRENITTNRLSFDDVTNSVYELLRNSINSDFLYFRLDSKIDHILIDEFQDTNVIQYKILEPLIDEINSGIGTKEFKTLFYVGDIKQSIYRFRGGAKELFHHVQQKYQVTLKPLSTNYRSKKNIVEFVNNVFKKKIKDYKDQNYINSENEGFVKVSISDDLIEDIVSNFFMLIEHGVNIEDIAILTYANDDAFIIEEAILKKDKTIKIVTQTTSKLINDKTVSAIIELLKYLYFKEEIYKTNFLTLVGLSWDEKIIVSDFDINKSLVSLIKQIIEKFELYFNNQEIWTLLQTASNYDDIESFLFESEDLNVESPTNKDNGAKILTIHKSKGLEFKHLIVCDRFKKKNSDRSSLIFEYNDITLKNIHVRLKKREFFDANYQNAIQNQKKLSIEDDLNLLYVAFTRAVDSLIVCKKDKTSSFDLLELDNYNKGDIEPGKIELAYDDEIKLQYKSLKLGLQEQNLKSTNERKDNFEAIHFGNALHYMLEILDSFNTKKDIEHAYWAMKNRYELFLEPNKCEEIKSRVLRLLDNKQFLELCNGKIYKEQPIIYNKELKQIDLLIQHENKWVVIDYKSSQQRHSEHIKQVKLYKKAIQKIVNKPVEAYLCYIKRQEIELFMI